MRVSAEENAVSSVISSHNLRDSQERHHNI